MKNIEIKVYSHYNESEILPLYESVGWTFYCKHPEMLKKAYENSLCVLAAYNDNSPVGIVRCVGDEYTIMFVQDLLVLPTYQRQGIGTALMKSLLSRYEHIYQIELCTDSNEETMHFYKSLGFHPHHEIGCCGFMMNGKL